MAIISQINLSVQGSPVRLVTISSDGKVAAASNLDNIFVLNGETIALKKILQGHLTPIKGLIISPDNRYILSWAGQMKVPPGLSKAEVKDGDIIIREIETGQVICKLKADGAYLVQRAVLHGPTRQLFVCTNRGKTTQWDLSKVLP